MEENSTGTLVLRQAVNTDYLGLSAYDAVVVYVLRTKIPAKIMHIVLWAQNVAFGGTSFSTLCRLRITLEDSSPPNPVDQLARPSYTLVKRKRPHLLVLT